jgi:hypothetical protein
MKSYDWLGHGIYFFEAAPSVAHSTHRSPSAIPTHAARRDPRINRLLAIAQRIKRERDRAIRERDINSAVLELWLASLWRGHRDSSADR